MQARSETVFSVERRFNKLVHDFGPDDAPAIIAGIRHFEMAWHNSVVDDDIPPRYKFKLYKGVVRCPYKLYQIYVGSNRRNLSYRVVVMFYNEAMSACWIYAFKKEKNNERKEVELAVKRADNHWNEEKES